MNNDIEHLFDHLNSLFFLSTCSSFASFLKIGFQIDFYEFFIIYMETQISSNLWLTFSLSTWCLWWTDVLNFNKVQFINFLFYG